MRNFTILLLIGILAACGSVCDLKASEFESNQGVLFKQFSTELNGELQVVLMKDSIVRCNANILQVTCSNYANKDLLLTAENGELTLKLLDEKSYYFTPNCSKKKITLYVRTQKDDTKVIASFEIFPRK